tara:strand:+ start:99 stop:263 length:165 start_codon:yes stop_codon:yes gene_type:complete
VLGAPENECRLPATVALQPWFRQTRLLSARVWFAMAKASKGLQLPQAQSAEYEI